MFQHCPFKCKLSFVITLQAKVLGMLMNVTGNLNICMQIPCLCLVLMNLGVYMSFVPKNKDENVNCGTSCCSEVSDTRAKIGLLYSSNRTT